MASAYGNGNALPNAAPTGEPLPGLAEDPSLVEDDASPSTPRTPTTPTDAGHVSAEEDFFSMSFDCKVWLASGRLLGSFKCDEISSVGKIRQDVKKALQDLISKGELHCASFALLRGDRTLHNDYVKIYELRDASSATDCSLTVMLSWY